MTNEGGGSEKGRSVKKYHHSFQEGARNYVTIAFVK